MADLDPDLIWSEAQDLAADLADAGASEEAAARAIASFLDAVVPLDALLPGAIGMAAEAADGPLFERIVKALVQAFRVDPGKRDERRARRAARRASRKAKRGGSDDR